MDGELIVHIERLAALRKQIPKWLLDKGEPDFSEINLDFLPFLDTGQKVIMIGNYGREYRGTVEAAGYYNPPILRLRYCRGWGNYYHADINMNSKLVGVYRGKKPVYFDRE